MKLFHAKRKNNRPTLTVIHGNPDDLEKQVVAFAFYPGDIPEESFAEPLEKLARPADSMERVYFFYESNPDVNGTESDVD